MKIVLAMLLLISTQAFANGARLTVFDCGQIEFVNMEMFGLAADETSVRELFVPCYLIEHPKGRLLFDGGLPKQFADQEGVSAIEGASVVYERWIVDQLQDQGIASADIDYIAYSHLHLDHAGTANALLSSNVLMQQKEWDGAFETDQAYIDTALIAGLKHSKITFIDGDHDVFGDGSVRLILAPGHTPGHQLLLIKLKNTGTILLSGDLYHTRANRALRRSPLFNTDPQETLRSMERIERLIVETGATLWIEHDAALAETLRKAPLYYD